MKKIKWKEWIEGQYEGSYDGQKCFEINGTHSLQDIRFMYTDAGFMPPKTYSVENLADGKRIALELLNDINSEENAENNRHFEERERKSTENFLRLMKESEVLIQKVNEQQMKDKAAFAPITNFVHVQPDSQYYTDLQQILTSLRYDMDRQHMIVGIENTIKMGYKLTLPKTKKKKK